LVEDHPCYGSDKCSHQGRSGHRVYRQSEEGNKEGGNDRPSANAVNVADDAENEAEGKNTLEGNVELLSMVQMVLGHSTPSLTSSYVSFSEDDIQQAAKFFMEKESARKTSARNSFFGKIEKIRQGDIQTRVELLTIGGHRVTTVITNDSLLRQGLKEGKLIAAEVKAPWVMLQKKDDEPECSAENRFSGIVADPQGRDQHGIYHADFRWD